MESDSKDRIIVLGGVPNKSLWLNNGKPTIREQDFVIWEGGVAMAIPSSIFKHPYKVMVLKKKIIPLGNVKGTHGGRRVYSIGG